MPTTNPIKTPAGYVPAFALGFSGPTGDLEVVDPAKPLPVALSSAEPLEVTPAVAPAPAPLEGSTTASIVAGPFIPAPGRPVVLTLAGAWDGVVQVKRSIDGGSTLHPLTAGGFAWGRYTENACEPVWEEQEDNVSLHLDIALTSGSIAFRIAQ